jgi:hypothetical protein
LGNPLPLSRSIRATALAVVLMLAGALAGRAAEVAGRTYTFQVVLLVAETSGPAVTEGIPPRAEKALANLREFLPYKSYKLLDLGWLRTMRGANATLAGLDGKTYRVGITFHSADGPGERLLIDAFSVTEVPLDPPDDVVFHSNNVAVTPRAPRAPEAVLNTTFGMELGETVVVGTSKLDGPSKALVVLLSALP